MLKVTNKYILIGVVNLASGLILSPFLVMHIFTDFAWWQMIVFYVLCVIPPLIGFLVFANVWGTLDKIKEVTKK